MDTSDQKVLFIEPFSGISGDMMVAALLDLGASFDDLQSKLASLPLKGYRLLPRDVRVQGFRPSSLTSTWGMSMRIEPLRIFAR